MGALDELRRVLIDAFTTRAEALRYDRGLLGDGLGNLWVAGDPEQRVWFRKNGQIAALTKVYCTKSRAVYRMPVVCGTLPEQPNLYQVLGWDREALEFVWGGAADVARHAAMHIWEADYGGDDPVMVWTRAMMPFRCSPQPVPDLTVQIQGPEMYLWATSWMEWAGDDVVDLTAEVPGVGLHRYCLVYIDGATSTAQLLSGGAIADIIPLTPASYPVPPTGSIPVGLIYLYGGQTEIGEGDIVDARVIVSTGPGGVSPGAHHLIDNTVHDDTDTYGAPVQGDMVRFNAVWERLAIGNAYELCVVNAAGTLHEWTAYIRPVRLGVGAAWADQDGTIALPETADPTQAANEGRLYVKDDGAGNSELYYMDEAGNIDKLTPIGGGGTLDDAYDFGGAGAGRTITADAGAVQIDGAGGLGSRGNVVLDDGVGDSPQLQFVGGSNDDTARIFLDDEAGAGNSRPIIELPGDLLSTSYLRVRNITPTSLLSVHADGRVQVHDGLLETSRTAAIAAQHSAVDGAGNAVTEILRLIHNLNVGAGAADMGARLLFQLANDGSIIEDAAAIDAVWEDPAAASEDSYLAFLVRVAGAALAEIGRLDSTGLVLADDKTINMDEQATPANPAGGRRKIYPKADGWYDLDSAGAETGPFGAGGGGTLDDAYDFGGAGAGRTITADAGAVRVEGAGGISSEDDITLDAGADVYPQADGGGLFQRNVNHWITPTDHFNAFAGYTWAAYAPFDGAPSTVDVATRPSLLQLANNTVGEDHFCYVAFGGTGNVTARLCKSTYNYVGVRLQNSDNDNDDFVELKLIDGTTQGTVAIQRSYQTGGAGIINTTFLDNLPNQFYALQIYKAGAGNHSVWYAINTPLFSLFSGVAAAWTGARGGIVFGARTVINYTAAVDWLNVS